MIWIMVLLFWLILFLIQPINAQAADTKRFEWSHVTVWIITGAVSQKDCIIDKMNSSIAVMPVKVAFYRFTNRPSFTTIFWDSNNEWISAVLSKWETSRMVVIYRKQIRCPRNAFDTCRRTGRYQICWFRGRKCNTLIGGIKSVLYSHTCSCPAEKWSVT